MKLPFSKLFGSVLVCAFCLSGILRPKESHAEPLIRPINTYPLSLPDLLPRVAKVFNEKPRTLVLITSDSSWNNHFVDPNSNRKQQEQVNKIEYQYSPGIIENTIVVRQVHQNVDVQIPALIPMDWYLKTALKRSRNNEFKKYIVEGFTDPRKRKNRMNTRGGSLRVLNAAIGNTAVALNISGNIDISGKVIFQDQEQISMNLQDNKSWDLDVDQSQRFNIEGNIGDKLNIEVSQNSEADFSWENNLILNYQGNDDDIWQKAQAGNISLRLPSTQFVYGGSSKSEGLFGIQMEHQLGPLNITSIVSREQVKQAGQTYTGGESEQGHSIKDYEFVVDRYFLLMRHSKINITLWMINFVISSTRTVSLGNTRCIKRPMMVLLREKHILIHQIPPVIMKPDNG